MSNPIKSLFKETAIYGLSSIIGRFLNYLLVPLYTSVFVNPAHYGVVSELYAWVAFLIVILSFGMETAYFRFLESSENKQKTFRDALWVVVIVNAFFLLGILFFHQDIANAMLYEEHSEYVVILGIVVSLDALSSLPLAKLRHQQKAIRFAGIQLSSIFINIVLNLVFMLFFFNSERPEEGVLFILIANLLASVIKPLILWRDFSILSESPNKESIKRMVKYSIPLMLAGFAGIINETLDRIMLKQILYNPSEPTSLDYAEGQVGIYSACYKLAMLVTIFIQAYRYAAEPFFFKQLKNEKRNEIYTNVMNYFVAAVGCVFLIVSLNIDILKYFIQNEVYWEGLKVVPILLMANVFFGIYINQSIWYKLSGQTKYGLYIALIGATITIVGNYIFIPKFGFVACAWVTLIVYAAQMVISYVWGQIHYPINYNLFRIGLYLGLALLIFASMDSFSLGSKAHSLAIGNILIASYMFFVFKMETKTINERN